MADAAAFSAHARVAPERWLDRLAPGLYAWGITVAWPASQRLAPLSSRLLAGGALFALLVGAALARFSPRASRIAGIWIFVAASLGTWVQLGGALGPTRLDPLQGILGWFGWLLFAVNWGGVPLARTRTPRSGASALPPSAPVEGGALRARRRVSRVMAASAVAATAPLVLAWWVESTERALLAHAVSLAAAIALVSLAVDPSAPSRSAAPAPSRDRPRRRLLDAASPLLVLAGLLLLGAVYTLLR